MKTVAFFVLGMFFGWLIEWIIDWLYWRKRYERIEQENAALQRQIDTLKTQNENLSKSRAKTVAAQRKKDNLKLIVGIGPVIEKKLNAAGITTFEEMSQLKPRQLEEILGELIKRLSDEADLIAQARQLARDKKSKA